jgi:hypothetical protein
MPYPQGKAGSSKKAAKVSHFFFPLGAREK